MRLKIEFIDAKHLRELLELSKSSEMALSLCFSGFSSTALVQINSFLPWIITARNNLKRILPPKTNTNKNTYANLPFQS